MGAVGFWNDLLGHGEAGTSGLSQDKELSGSEGPYFRLKKF